MTYEIDPKPNSDEQFCDNCEMIVDKTDILETIDGISGCVNCVSRCEWCGNDYFRDEMHNNHYLGYVCNACKNAEDYMSMNEAEITKHALRSLFDNCTKSAEPLIIELAFKKGYYDLAHELKNDKS